jgi:type IV secretion system protein VirD4
MRISAFTDSVPPVAYVDPATIAGVSLALHAGVFGLRAAFAVLAPRHLRGKRAIHGKRDWAGIREVARLFPDASGIVIGERYRVDRDSVSARPFRAAA